ncbi:hypothetical protein, partial [Thermoactinospora rubra]|uniref:hypothetical protein n=1 Tax=Thermoactinospora rubra TaxID=1088767 RepID=UPI00117D3691
MGDSHGFSRFVADHADRLARTAYVLTGDAAQARDLARRALAAVGRQWPALRWNRPGEAAFRELYHPFLEGAPGALPVPGLSRRGWAAVVALFHDGHHELIAARLCGLSVPDLHVEVSQALFHLRRARPELFADAAGQPGAVRPAVPEEPRQTGWAAPWDAPAQRPAEPPADTGPGLRAALAAYAADAPLLQDAFDLVLEVERRRRARTAKLAAVIAVTAAALVTGLVYGVSALGEAVAARQERAGESSTSYDEYMEDEDGLWAYAEEEPVPDAALTRLPEPVKYAYQGWCRERPDPRNPPPCLQWRVVTGSGKEWRIAGAQAGVPEGAKESLPFTVSQDGWRIAYVRSEDFRYIVHDLRTGTQKAIEVAHEGMEPRLHASPNGRFFAVTFGVPENARGAMLDFETGRSLQSIGGDILAIRNDGWRVVRTKREVTNVPGFAVLTHLGLEGPDGRIHRAFRVDAGMLDYGCAISPNGRALAMVTRDLKLVKMDLRTGLVSGERENAEDAVSVERWDRHGVLLRVWGEDDGVYLDYESEGHGYQNAGQCSGLQAG